MVNLQQESNQQSAIRSDALLSPALTITDIRTSDSPPQLAYSFTYLIMEA
jgi:hypothetical protein